MSYKFEYIRLLVSNFRACFMFYKDVMGFQATYGTENDTYADFNTGSVSIALFDKLEMSKAIGTSLLPGDAQAQDKVCLIFSVDNVDSACQQLKMLGIPIIVEPSDHPDWGIRTVHLRDPEGNLIEINQPMQRS